MEDGPSSEGGEEADWDNFSSLISRLYDAEAKWVSPESFLCLMTTYSILIILGCAGNCLVLATILRSPDMRTARNVFIGNLAVSDLCLCVVTMPLTLVEVVYQRWHWGATPLLCHLQYPLQTVFVVISSLSISAIAVDRCIVICCTTIHNWSTRRCLLVSGLVWVAGLVVTAPLGLYRQLLSTAESLTLTGYPFAEMVRMYDSQASYNVTAAKIMVRLADNVAFANESQEYNWKVTPSLKEMEPGPQQMVIHFVQFLISEMKLPQDKIVEFAECNEVFPSPSLEKIYTAMLHGIQFLLPLVTVAVSNTLIYCKLRERLQTFSAMEMTDKRRGDVQRMRRTCWLLVCMVTIFLFCWLPLTLFNFFITHINLATDDNTFFSMFALCHVVGMTSAWANPILYGFLNENFKKEFHVMFDNIRKLFLKKERTSNEPPCMDNDMERTQLTKHV